MNPLPILALAFALTACGGATMDSQDGEQPAVAGLEADQPPPPVTGSAGEGSTTSEGDIGMLSSRGAQTGQAGGGGAAAEGDEVVGAGLAFSVPESWQREAPSSSMRMAQASIPGAGGDGVLAVFFFGPGGGGGVEANLERWIGQIEGGTPSRESFDSGGLRVTWVDVSGTLMPSGLGMGPTEPQPGSRLFGAVIEGPGGPWFFKATGPEETLAAERDAFVAMLRSARLVS